MCTVLAATHPLPVHRYAQNKEAWQHDYATSYVKMVSTFATWAPVEPFYISGQECAKGWLSERRSSQACLDSCKDHSAGCPSDCMCATGFRKDKHGNVQVSLQRSLSLPSPPSTPLWLLASAHSALLHSRDGSCYADAALDASGLCKSLRVVP
jgi:hypothetical protein